MNSRLVVDPIRILIVERQQLVADALEALLSRQPGMVVVGNFGCARTRLRMPRN